MPISATANNKFSTLTLQNVADTFQLTESDLLIFPKQFFEFDKISVKKIVAKAKGRIEYWTEQELVMKYISPILNLIDISGLNYNTFAQRPISGRVQNYKMSGYVDFLVAKGKYEPTQPYFFIHKFKKSLNQTNDPFGQLLREMLVAQEINSDPLVYGLVIIGRFWHFVILNGREFTRLAPIDSLDIIDLQIIFDRLNGAKHYIEEKLKIK